MTDLVKRLRGCVGDSLEEEAADEIERLRVGIQSYLEDDFALKYSRRNRHNYFRALLNPKDSKDD